MQAAINWDRRCIVWNFFGVDLTAYTNQIIYNWETDSWSNNVLSVDWLVPVEYTGSFSEGDPRLRRIIGGFISGTHHQLSGTSVAATLETGEFEPVPGQRTFVSSVRPVIENADANTAVAIKTRDLPGVAKISTASTTEGAQGFCAFNADARYFSIETTIPAAADWDKAHSVLIDARQSGAS